MRGMKHSVSAMEETTNDMRMVTSSSRSKIIENDNNTPISDILARNAYTLTTKTFCICDKAKVASGQ